MPTESETSKNRLKRGAETYLNTAAEVLRATADAEADRVAEVAAVLAERLRDGKVLYTCGNGGSAADAQHVAAELSGKFYIDRPGLPALSLNTNVSAITAIANDFSYEDVFVRQLSGCARPGDLLMAFTTSGRSPNIRRAVEWASDHGVTTIAFTGETGRGWARSCDYGFVIPSDDTPHIQQGHITIGHAICALAEADLYGPDGTPPRGSDRPAAR